MMYYSRLKMASVVAVCLLGVVLCLPNALRQPSAALPWRQIHLGLDLRGGSYLLMQVDMPSITSDRLQTLADGTRQALLGAGLGYRNIATDAPAGTVTFTPRDPSETDADLKALRAMPTTVPGEFSVDRRQDGSIAITLSPTAMRERAREAVTQSIEIVRRRIDATGAVDPEITRQGDDRIVVELPGISDPEHVKRLLGTTAKMTFHMVQDNALGTVAGPGVTLLPMLNAPDQKLPILDHVEVDGSDLTNAGAAIDQQTGEWAVNFSFDSVGARAFAATTRANIGHRFAIVLDNKVVQAPVIRGAITGGNGQIVGGFDAQSATDLALLLRAGALPAPLSVIEQRSIGPSLGADSIRAGALSLGAGFVLVIAFMGLFYGRFGWYANVALLANLVLMAALLSLFQATLTLPGMAGMLLTLGMAVDANILINERIREEVGRGRTALAAMQAGFERATSTIVDSNATALLAHVMLFVFGTGPVRGFALTITIGIVTTLFTTLLLSRMLMVRWYARTRPTVLPV
ncbi:preprotein translocase subunit SecD [Gluconacetobacter johannae DSM 13595]|uniref:Protein translocase subunit SecD n=1 Tax=Gluconacetobacter johannae TaxID=112140 RepID=A0A7W4J6T4_9PROT|nr:protein translocase subunit SecD [Gluconacetobacter johannae]MBB2175790.1 protein translocase subunit SecD [Gluconacetobacter johannae]GBQ82854.1 preprotein translocase subunit SecD [Gluconacetobacter johannae DSM 13595]